jgi:hypothetical protein
MIARTLRGLGALALIARALIGWPAALRADRCGGRVVARPV